MENIFVTSDLHFGHDKEFCYGPRGFTSAKEMNEWLLERYNRIVRANDEVYILGDLVVGNVEEGMEYARWLNGKIHLVLGNHDSPKKIEQYKDMKNILTISFADAFTYNKFHFYLSHYPTLTANYTDGGLRNKVYNLCGHSHTTDPFFHSEFGAIYHCEVDAHNNYPVAVDDIIKDLRSFYLDKE